MKIHSTRLTFFYKYIFIVLWVGIFGFGTIAVFNSQETALTKYGILFLSVVSTVNFYLIFGRVKKVEISENKLCVSNFISSIEINLAEIKSISGSVLLYPALIWLKLKSPTKFGRTITFIPKQRFFGAFTQHPMVDELKTICKIS